MSSPKHTHWQSFKNSAASKRTTLALTSASVCLAIHSRQAGFFRSVTLPVTLNGVMWTTQVSTCPVMKSCHIQSQLWIKLWFNGPCQRLGKPRGRFVSVAGVAVYSKGSQPYLSTLQTKYTAQKTLHPSRTRFPARPFHSISRRGAAGRVPVRSAALLPGEGSAAPTSRRRGQSPVTVPAAGALGRGEVSDAFPSRGGGCTAETAPRVSLRDTKGVSWALLSGIK